MDTNTKLGSYAAGYTCNEDQCKYLPPMNITDLKLHEEMAHQNTDIEFRSHFYRKLVGADFNEEDIRMTRGRKFSLYRLRHAHLTAHDSLVFQPWSQEELHQQMNHYCRIHVVADDSNVTVQSALKCEVIHNKEEYLEHLHDFVICAEEIYAMCTILAEPRLEDSKLSGISNCGEICDRFVALTKYRGHFVKESSTTFLGRISRLLISSSQIHQHVEDNLPIIMLLSRICNVFNTLVAYWLPLHIFIRTFFDGSLKILLNRLRHGEYQGMSELCLINLILISLFGLSGLAYQSIVDSSNVSTALLLWYTWILMHHINTSLKISSHLRAGLSHYQFQTVKCVIYRSLFNAISHMDFLLYLSHTCSYYYCLITQILIIVVYNAVKRFSVRKPAPLLLNTHLILVISIIGLFCEPTEYRFDNYKYYYLIPYAFYYYYASTLGRGDFIGYFKQENQVERHIREIIKNIDMWGEDIPTEFVVGNDVVDIKIVIKQSKSVMDIISYLTKLRHASILFIIIVFYTSSMESVLMFMVVFLWSYTELCKMFAKLAYSFRSNVLDTLKK